MWLAFDTASDRASVALGATAAAAIEENLAGARRHATELLGMIEAVLRRGARTLDDVTGIVLSDGPGSFTGLRVGATVAKALVRVHGWPLWIAPSLLVRCLGGVAREGIPEGATVVAVTNALRGEVFAAAYRFMAAEIVTELSPSVWTPERLTQRAAPPALIVGEVPPEARVLLEAWVGRPLLGPPEGAPHARELIALLGRTGGATRVDDVQSWEPVYGRPAEAQVRWEVTHGRPLPNSAGDSR